MLSVGFRWSPPRTCRVPAGAQGAGSGSGPATVLALQAGAGLTCLSFCCLSFSLENRTQENVLLVLSVAPKESCG